MSGDPAVASTAYLRYPHLFGDLVAFTAADDVWVGPVDGGRAWRLTADRQPVRCPRFSPDGSHLAFLSHRDGHPEAMVVPVDGGEAQRLTFWGATNTAVLGWTPDGRVLVASNAGEASLRHGVVKAVALDGSVERMPWGPAGGVAVRSDGEATTAVALATPASRPPAHWKRYRGGTAPRLWLDPDGTGGWTQLLADEPASLVDPMWVGDTLVFVSDRAAHFPDATHEQANLWAWDTPRDDATLRRLTAQDESLGYVRDASTDGRRIVWHSRGRLWLLDALDAEPRPIESTVPGTVPGRRGAKPTEGLHRMQPDHGGDASLVSWRGTTFRLTHRSGPALAIVADSAVRTREPVLLGTTGRVALVTDVDGDDAIDVHDFDIVGAPRRLVTPGRGGDADLGRVLHLAASPDGNTLALVTHDGRVATVDVESGDVRECGRSPQGEALTPRFSPDGRYLAWSQGTGPEGSLHQIVIVDLRSDDDAIALTSGKYHDRDLDFTRDGKHLVFLSDRTFDPIYDDQEFTLVFSGSTRPWLLPLAADEPAPFGPSVDGWPIREVTGPPGRAERDGNGARSDGGEVPASPDVDADEAEARVTPFPVPSAGYRDLRAARDGVTWVRLATDTGELGSRRAGIDGDDPADQVEYFGFATRRAVVVSEKVAAHEVTGDGSRIVVRHGDKAWVQPADKKPDDDDPDDPNRVPIDLSRLRFEIDPLAEWMQMFDESARIMRDHFWRADMDGVDWDATVARWRDVVPLARTHDDLVDMLWETNGELNTSHAYVMPADTPGDADRRLGLLGADLSPDDGGWRIDRILPGESSDPAARSPLLAAGVGARAGDLIVAVDGNPVDPTHGPARNLIGAADKPVQLTLRRDESHRHVVVVPIGDEEILRYQDWVRSRRDYVTEATDGRIGYLHVPDMMSLGWAQLHRDLRLASRSEGLVADVRYNRGGHTSQLVLARLAPRVVGWALARHYEFPETYPSQAPRGPVVFVANEWSGSDGDIVNAAGQAMGVGPVVGVRTWGGVVGIDGRFDLVDGTSITQPRYAFWLEGKGFGVENHGVDPDIEVVHAPSDFDADDDPQLDRAIEEALRLLTERPASTPPPFPGPKVSSPSAPSPGA